MFIYLCYVIRLNCLFKRNSYFKNVDKVMIKIFSWRLFYYCIGVIFYNFIRYINDGNENVLGKNMI